MANSHNFTAIHHNLLQPITTITAGNTNLQMMLQHGLFHLHIIVIVILEEKVVEVVVKTNGKVVAEAEVVVKSNEKVVAEADVFNEKVVAEAVLLIKTKKKEVAEVVEIVD